MKNIFVFVPKRIQWLLPVFLLIAATALTFSFQNVRSAGIQHFSILAESMHPIDSTIQFNNTSAYLVTTSNSTYSPGEATYIGQVNLPDGAVISGVHIYGIDRDNSVNFGAGLYRYNQDSAPVFAAVTTFQNTTAAPNKVVMNQVPISSGLATIDNQNYSYGLFINLPRSTAAPNISNPDLAILRIVIDWSYDTYLPVIQH